MPRIFISYRRADSISESGRIHDHLERAYGGRNVFKDVDDIPPGLDFRKVLDDEVAQCDVLLTIIGNKWASVADNDGNPRLQNPDDFVRIEVESGLKRGDEVLVIPVLVNNATMPPASQLPDSLQDLTYRNAVIVRNDPDFNRDMQRLIDYINRYRKQNRPNRLPFLIGGGVVALVIMVAILLLTQPPSDPEPVIEATQAVVVESVDTATPDEPAPTLASGDADGAKSLVDEADDLAGNANYDEAIDLYTQAIEADPTYANAYVGRALANSSGYGDYATAITDLEQAVELDPTYAEAYSVLGQFNFFEGNYDAVESNLNRALELNPSDVNARRVLADYFISNGRYTDAEAQYSAILDNTENLDPDMRYDARLGIAYTQEATGNTDEAQLILQEAIEINPDRFEAYSRLGNMHVYQGKFDSALDFLNTALDKNDTSADIYNNRGLANLGLQNYTDAVNDFDSSLQLNPSRPDTYIGRGRAYSAVGNYVSAIADFSQAIARDEDDGNAYYWRGLAHFESGNFQLAIDDLTIAIARDVFAGDAYGYRGLAYQELENNEDAKSDFETALEYGIEGDLAYDVLVELGWLNLTLTNDAEASNYFSEAITLRPDLSTAYQGQIALSLTRANESESDSDATNELLLALDVANRAITQITGNATLYVQRAEVNIWLYDLTEDFNYQEAGLADLDTAIELDGEFARAYQLRAIIYPDRDDYTLDDALEQAEIAFDLDEANPEIHLILADIHEEMGNIEQAISFLELAIENTADEDLQADYQEDLDRLRGDDTSE